MNRLMIAGTGSGCGKTTVSCALMAALKSSGKNIAAFKCGPDYIDPMFHRRALSTKSYNLDIFLTGEENVCHSLQLYGKNKDLCLIEGVMGLYDGIGAGGYASSNHLSAVTETPVVLVVGAKGKAASLCAEIYGFLNYEKNNICAIIINNVSESMYPFYKNMIEQRLLVKVLGFMPNIQEANIGSRHLGLISADEITDIQKKLNILGENALKHIDIQQLLDIAQKAKPLKTEVNFSNEVKVESCVKIYVAEDEAFNFYYEENHHILNALGGELCFFSPLRDKILPDDANGLVLWGGYPELWAEKLSENVSMKESIRKRIEGGLPVYAECGGFIYLQESLSDLQGRSYPMVGAIKGHVQMTKALQKFGYAELTANCHNMLCNKGDKINAHSFRYSCSSNEGDSFTAVKKSTGIQYPCIEAEKNIFAGYPHIHFGGNKELAKRFIKACEKYKMRLGRF